MPSRLHRLTRLLAPALLLAAAAPAPAGAVSVAQHPLPGPLSPAVALAAWPGGLALTRDEGTARVVLERVTTSPSFAVGPPQALEPLALGTGPDGNLWLIGGQPVPGAAPDLALEDLGASGAPAVRLRFAAPLGSADWPGAIAAGPDGSLWIANMTAEAIERLTPAGQLQTYALPRPGAPTSIAVAPDGSAWFTELAAGAIGEVTPQGAVVERAVGDAGGFGSAEPYAIVLGPDGALWFTEQNAGRIGRITTEGALQEFPIPAAAGVAAGEFGAPAPKGIAVGPEGDVWFTDPGDESVGRVTPAGAVSEFPIPAPAPASPGAIAAYGGRLWFTEAGLQALGSADPASTSPGTPAQAPGRTRAQTAFSRCRGRRSHAARCRRRARRAGTRRAAPVPPSHAAAGSL